MAFAMSLPRTKRVKYLEPDGKEVYQEEDRWTLVHAVHNQVASEPSQADKDDTEQPTPSTMPRAPEEVLEKLQMARGEISMMLDLIDMLESQQHIGISNVPPQKSTLQQLAQQRDLRLQTRRSQLKDASQRIKKGVVSLRTHLQLENDYFTRIAELASKWHVKPSPDFKAALDAAPFYVDPNIAGLALPAEAVQRIDLGRNADGSLQVREAEGEIVNDPEGIHRSLRKQQESLVWQAIKARLLEEAQASSRSSAAQSLVKELLDALQSDSQPDFAELRALILRSYLAGLQEKQKPGHPLRLLPSINSWIRHRWYFKTLCRSLVQQAQALEASGQKTMHIITRGDSAEVRGVGSQAGGGSRWASAGVLASIGKQDIESLLTRMLLE